MPTVRELCAQIEALLDSQSANSDNNLSLVNALLTELQRHDDVMLEELFRRISGRPRARTRAPQAAGVQRPIPTSRFDESVWLKRASKSYFDDSAFRSLLNELEEGRSPTRDGLNRLYNSLFERDRPLPKKGTRERLIQDIADERNASVRSQKAAKVLTGD